MDVGMFLSVLSLLAEFLIHCQDLLFRPMKVGEEKRFLLSPLGETHVWVLPASKTVESFAENEVTCGSPFSILLWLF